MSVVHGMIFRMPSTPHEVTAELLRNNPMLGLALVYHDVFPIPPGVRARLGDSNLSTVVPLLKGLFGDAVVILETDDGSWKRVVVIDPQLKPPEPWKRRSLAAYTAVAGAVHDCDSALVLICHDQHTANECRKTIYTGHPEYDLRPFVIYGRRPPDPFDPALSFARHELVVQSSFTKYLDLDDPETRGKVLKCLSELDERRQAVYSHFVLVAASPAARRELRGKMAINIEDDPFIASFMAKGRLQKARELTLRLLALRQLGTPDRVHELVGSCEDLDILGLWHDRAATAKSLNAVFGSYPGWKNGIAAA